MSFTLAECKAMLGRRVTYDYYLQLVDGVENFVQAPNNVQASMTSGAYNFGAPAAKKSTAARKVTEFKYRVPIVSYVLAYDEYGLTSFESLSTKQMFGFL